MHEHVQYHLEYFVCLSSEHKDRVTQSFLKQAPNVSNIRLLLFLPRIACNKSIFFNDDNQKELQKAGREGEALVHVIIQQRGDNHRFDRNLTSTKVYYPEHVKKKHLIFFFFFNYFEIQPMQNQ